MLNLRQKGPGSQEARRDQMNVKPNKTDIEAGRFTLTVTAVDLPNNTVSVIEGPRRPGADLQGQHHRQAGHAEEDQGRRRGDRPHDAADGDGDLAGELAFDQSDSGNTSRSLYIMSRCSSSIGSSAAAVAASSVSRAAREPASIAHCSCGSGANSAMKVAL